jgi:hypothetical protein
MRISVFNMYTIKVKNQLNEFIGEFDSFSELTLGKRLNNYGTCEFALPISDSKIASLISLRRNTVWIYRDGQLKWSGEMAMKNGKIDDKGSGIVKINCFDWLEQLKFRYTAAETIYTDTDAGQIFWNEIDQSQQQTNGDLGITLGTIEPTMDRDRTYRNDQIYTLGVNLSNVISGFDFEINNLKVFNVAQTIGVDRTDSIVFEYGHNMKSVQVTEDFTNPVNRAIVLGEATDLGQLQRVDTDDLTSQALIGLREDVLTEPGVSDLDTFTEKGESLNRKYNAALLKIDQEILANSVTIDQFSLGDLVRVKIQNNIYNIDEEYRVFEWEVKVNDKDEEQLSVVLGKFTI